MNAVRVHEFLTPPGRCSRSPGSTIPSGTWGHRSLLLQLLVALLAWGAQPQPGAAQDVSALQGTFVLEPEAGDDVAEAIREATAPFNFLHRRFARSHLERQHQPYRTITIEQDEHTVSLSIDGGEPVRAPADGTPVEWVSRDGARVLVSIVRDAEGIHRSVTAEGRKREDVFRPMGDRSGMTMEVTAEINGHAPLQYGLTFRREP